MRWHRAAHSLAGAAGALGAHVLEAGARAVMASDSCPSAAQLQQLRLDAAATMSALLALANRPA